MLEQRPPKWRTLSAEAQAAHYAEALREARELGKTASPEGQRWIESRLRLHTPPAVTMRHDGAG